VLVSETLGDETKNVLDDATRMVSFIKGQFIPDIFTVCILLCVTNLWLGKVSVNTAKMVLRLINTS
jgi:hypothetical protein